MKKITEIVISTMLMPMMALAVELSDGLVAWYKFDGDLNDASGNQHTQAVSGASLYAEDRYGNPQSAFMLDGSTCLYKSGSGKSWQEMTYWLSNYTFSCWVKATEETKLYNIASSGIYGTSSSVKYICGCTDFPIAIGTNGITIFEHADCFLPCVYKYEGAIGTQWRLLSMTVSENTNAVIYLDGIEIGSFKKLLTTASALLGLGSYNTTLELNARGIGAFLYGGHFKGCIDDVRFYNRALSVNEIKLLYDRNCEIGLVAWYKFDGNTKDLSGNGYDLVNRGEAYPDTDRNGIEKCAYRFCGADNSRLVLMSGVDLTVTNAFSFALWFRTTASMSEHGSSGTAWNPGNDVLNSGYGNFVGTGLRVGKDGIAVIEHGSCYRPTVFTYLADLGLRWHHAVVTVENNSGQKVYLDGNYLGQATINSGSLVSSRGNGVKAFSFADGIGGCGWGYYTGSVDDFRVYDHALSSDEVKALYENEIQVLNVTFDAQGGEVTHDVLSVTNGMVIGELPTAEKTGHKFLGWFTEMTNGVQVSSETIITSNVTFYAHWFDTSFGNVTGATNALWRTGGAANWNVEETADGWDVKSGTIGKSSETWIECVVTNGCRVSYDWKVSCEPGEEEEMYDYLSLKVDGEQMDAICGESGWTNGTVFVAGEGEHILRWTYQKDNRTSEGEDCGWLGRVKVDPEVPVTFDDNDATSGEVPTIATAYMGDTIIIPGTGTLAKSCYTFGGWKHGDTVHDEGASLAITNNEVTFVAVWNAKLLGSVTLATPETSHVTTEKIGISFNVPENATTIRYTIDGSDPTIDSPIYTGPFEIGSKSVTVKAIAYAEDWFDSACATWVLTRAPWSASECLNIETRTFSYAGNADWARDLETTHDGEASMRSGAIDDKQKSTIQMSVAGSGTIAFWCKVSSECDPDDGSVYDGLSVLVDGNEVFDDLIGGDVDWTNITIAVSGDGEHTIVWRYEKDKTGSAGADCAWLDEMLWQADQTVVTAAETGSEDVVIGREWIERDLVKRYGAGKTELFRNKYGTDYDLAVRKLSGKAVNGKPACVWQDYVAGTDPTNTNSIFTASIDVVDGIPVVTWDPDLKTKRSYSVWGREELNDTKGWVCPTNSAHHFFKVSVEMP